MEETLFNKEKESEESIRWVLERAIELFKDNKELILSKSILCPLRQFQALTMTIMLPSYVELTNALSSMCMVFEMADKPIEQNECERLIRYLVLYWKEIYSFQRLVVMKSGGAHAHRT